MNESVFGLDGRSPSRVEQLRTKVMVEPEAVTTLLRRRALGALLRNFLCVVGLKRS